MYKIHTYVYSISKIIMEKCSENFEEIPDARCTFNHYSCTVDEIQTILCQ